MLAGAALTQAAALAQAAAPARVLRCCVILFTVPGRMDALECRARRCTAVCVQRRSRSRSFSLKFKHHNVSTNYDLQEQLPRLAFLRSSGAASQAPARAIASRGEDRGVGCTVVTYKEMEDQLAEWEIAASSAFSSHFCAAMRAADGALAAGIGEQCSEAIVISPPPP